MTSESFWKMELTLWLWGIGGLNCAPERVRVFWRIVIFQDCNGHFSRLISCADFDRSSCQEEISGTSSKVSKNP